MSLEVNSLQTSNHVPNLNVGTADGAKRNTLNNQQSIFLMEKLDSIKDKQGFIGKSWNGIKELTGLGVSQSDCEDVIMKYIQNPTDEMYEEALKYLEKYDKKQETMVDLVENVVTGIGGIAVATTAVMGGPIGWGIAIAEAAPIGAALKVGINFFERATNDIEGDAFDVKEIAKDATTGIVTSVTSAVSSGVGIGVKAGKAGLSIFNGGKCGLACGSASGAVNYMSDVLFGDKDFDIKELAASTLTSGFVSCNVGMGVGGGIYALSSIAGNVGKEVATTTGQTIVKDSLASSLRKALGQGEKSIMQS